MKTKKEMDAKAENLMNELKGTSHVTMGICPVCCGDCEIDKPKKASHTPTPKDLTIREGHRQGIPVFEIATQFSMREQAEQVVRAVNCHEELLEALKHERKTNVRNGSPRAERLDKIIAKAEGK